MFEGPLDLLLHLISKHKLNIKDIPISEIVDQYLEAINNMAIHDMDIAGEFLEMAARLVYIKTVSLLPVHEEAAELKKELEGRLIEYSLCKETAALLKERFNGGIVTKKPMKLKIDMTYALTHNSEELRKAYLNIDMRRLADIAPTDAAFTKIVAEKYVPVASMIVYVLKSLYSEGKCSLTGLFGGIKNRSERVAAFLAVLEMSKSGRIILNDDNSEIILNNSYTESMDELHSDFDEEENRADDKQ